MRPFITHLAKVFMRLLPLPQALRRQKLPDLPD
jgi:hypothetical protein